MLLLKRWTLLLVFFNLLFCSTFACSMPVGLIRTPMDKLSSTAYPTLGFIIDLPEQPQDIYSQYILKKYDSDTYKNNTNTKGALVLMMHPKWSGQSLTEPKYLLEFTIIRLSPGAFESFKLGNHRENQCLCFGREQTNFASSIVEKIVTEKDTSNTFNCFRKDIKLKDGDIIIANARLVREEQILKYENDDKAVIKRILDSIKPL